MVEYNEQVGSHLPSIHDSTYTWNDFINILKQTNGETYSRDKIYFIEDVNTQANFLKKLNEEILSTTEILENLLNSIEEEENEEVPL